MKFQLVLIYERQHWQHPLEHLWNRNDTERCTFLPRTLQEQRYKH